MFVEIKFIWNWWDKIIIVIYFYTWYNLNNWILFFYLNYWEIMQSKISDRPSETLEAKMVLFFAFYI